MRVKVTPDRELEPPDEEPVDWVEWNRAFHRQWMVYKRIASEWDINLGYGESAAEFSWENDGGELPGEEAARQELCSRFDCICTCRGLE